MSETETERLALSPEPFRRGELVRVTRNVDGIARGTQGMVIGWYVNKPGQVVVHLWDGGSREIPTEALERAA